MRKFVLFTSSFKEALASFPRETLEKTRKTIQDESGFSLLELSIVLVILGILGGLSLPLLTRHLSAQKVNATRERQEQIIASLASYALREGRLPCPASKEAQGDYKGRDQGECQTPGLVPYRTLGLPEAYAKDGQGNWMTYAIEPALNITEWREGSQDFCSGIVPQLSICNEDGGKVLGSLGYSGSTKTNNFVAAVIVSHGQDKRLNSRDQEENKNSDLAFVDRPYSTNLQNPFTDIVKWVSRDNLMALYARQPCGREKS